jgi:hypothetical protein
MTYPIFNSFINQIKNELESRSIPIKSFKTWHKDPINATGLEILIDVSNQNNFIKNVSINFDWDRFRETVMAQQLDGLEEHPMLQEQNLKSVTVSPQIDIEISWIFDEEKSQIALPNHPGNKRLDTTGEWMQKINKKVNNLLAEDDIITRWHLEVEGNPNGRHISSISLISYFRYTLTHLKSLNEAHDFINGHLRDLLVKSQKIRRISDDTLQNAA